MSAYNAFIWRELQLHDIDVLRAELQNRFSILSDETFVRETVQTQIGQETYDSAILRTPQEVSLQNSLRFLTYHRELQRAGMRRSVALPYLP
jgi:hypothetical protein